MKIMTYMFAILLVIAVGCDSPDERLVHQLAETSREVVQQNKEVAKTQHEIAEGSKQLVNAVAESRHEHNGMQQDLQQQRDHLERERKSIAANRRSESRLVPVLETTGLLIVAALPLVLCWYLLHGLRGQDEEVSEVLVSQLVSRSPELLNTKSRRPEIGLNIRSTEDEELPF
jgi:ABC-type transport system involved in cytochrome bd biosynthesis fused ATPase/permease subunit